MWKQRNHRYVYRDDESFYKPVYVKYDRCQFTRWRYAVCNGQESIEARARREGWQETAAPTMPPFPSEYTGDEIEKSTLNLDLYNLDGTVTSLLSVLAAIEGVDKAIRDWHGEGSTLKETWTPNEGEEGSEAYLWARSKPIVMLAGSLT